MSSSFESLPDRLNPSEPQLVGHPQLVGDGYPFLLETEIGRDLVSVLRLRAARQPAQMGFCYLGEDDQIEDSITYGQLHEEAAKIAEQLMSIGATGNQVLLLYPPGIRFLAGFFGCLYAGAIAVPCYPPKSSRTDARLQGIIADSNSQIVLSDSATLAQLPRLKSLTPEVGDLTWLATDHLPDNNASPEDGGDARLFSAPETILLGRNEALPRDSETVTNLHRGYNHTAHSSDLAFLQYTSGSTGDPKGVMVSHENLLRNIEDLDRGWDHTPDSVMVSWLPTFHDMGLIYGALLPIVKGFPCYLMAPATFLKRPLRWLEAIARFGGTHTAAPNFAFDLCVRRSTSEQRAALNLSRWQVALNAAEPIRAGTIDRFCEAFAISGFRRTTFCPGYGLAEATLKVTSARIHDAVYECHVHSGDLAENRVALVDRSEPDAQTLIGCGVSEIDTEIAIVDPATRQECGANEIGEIWVSGSTVAGGYFGRPEQTQATFRAGKTDCETAQAYLRTGDLGFQRDGQLFVTGRLKELIIIRGLNYYPQDIEQSVQQSDPSLQVDGGAAFTVNVAGEERLVVVQEVRRECRRSVNAEEVTGRIRDAVFLDHDLSVHEVILVRPSSIPKTSSGKIQRQQCRHRYLAGDWARLNPPESGTETTFPSVPKPQTAKCCELLTGLRQAVADVCQVPHETLPVDLPLSQLGVDSLRTAELLDRLNRTLSTPVPSELVLQNPTLEQLTVGLSRSLEDPASGPTLSPLLAVNVPTDDAAVKRSPFFCMHPVGGMIYPYYALARQLGEERGFFGLRAAGLFADPDITVEAMASRYVQAIREEQPQGPYFLGGWSFGAFLAYEVARQLDQQNQQVGLLAILDMPVLPTARFHTEWSALRFHATQTLPCLWPIFRDFFTMAAKKGGKLESAAARRPDEEREEQSSSQAFAALHHAGWRVFSRDSACRRILRTTRANSKAMRAYRPGDFSGTVTLFRTESVVSSCGDLRLGWQNLAAGGVEVEWIPGRHHTLLSKPHVASLANALSRRLAAAD